MSETPELPEDDDPDLLRLWLEDDVLHCSLQLASEEPSFWGNVLGDLTRHIAEALAEEAGIEPAEAFAQLRQALQEDLDNTPEEGE